MANHSLEWRRVEPRTRGDGLAHRDVVLGGNTPFHPHYRAEDDHYRARAVCQQLGLPPAISTCRKHPLAKLEQLAHRLVLELQSQVFRIDADSVEGILTIEDSVSLEDVGVFHREDVRRGTPFPHGQGHGRWVPRLTPSPRDGG